MTCSLGPLQPASKKAWYDFDYVHPGGHPFAIFHFKYRSLGTSTLIVSVCTLTRLLAALKSLHIVSHAPSPTPLEDRPVDELSTAELAELVKRYRVHLLFLSNIKHTDTPIGKRSKRQCIKQERAAGVKREREVSHDIQDDEDMTVEEGRRMKRQHLPSEEDEVIVLD